jgi:hypothetical protein
MGCSTGHTKDFTQILKPAKKTINLINAAILLIIFSPLPTRSSPEQLNTAPPVFLHGHVSSPISPPLIQRKFGWLLRAVVNWRPPKDTTNFVIFIFLRQIPMAEKTR